MGVQRSNRSTNIDGTCTSSWARSLTIHKLTNTATDCTRCAEREFLGQRMHIYIWSGLRNTTVHVHACRTRWLGLHQLGIKGSHVPGPACVHIKPVRRPHVASYTSILRFLTVRPQKSAVLYTCAHTYKQQQHHRLT